MDSVQHRGGVRYAVTMTSQHDKPKRWQFGLKSLFAVTFVAAIAASIAKATGFWGIGMILLTYFVWIVCASLVHWSHKNHHIR